MKRYPAQIRYEKKHPTVSFRLDRDLKARLKKALEGKSFAEFVKEGLGVIEREKASLTKAYGNGYERAMEKFGVYASCAICGKPMLIEHDDDKKELAHFIEARNWCHPSCGRGERRAKLFK